MMIELAKADPAEAAERYPSPTLRARLPGRHIDLLLVLCIAFAPVQWITLLQVGGFSLEPFHFPLMILIVLTVARPRFYLAMVSTLHLNISWLLPFFVYLFFIAVSLGYSYYSGGEASLARQMFFMTFGLLVAARLAAFSDPGRTLYIGSALSLLVYYLAIEVSAAHIGKSALTSFADFAAGGDFNALTYQFFRAVFNAFQTREAEFNASLRNNIASALLICFICFWVGARSSPASIGKAVFDLVLGGVFLFSIGIILSRSVIISMVLSFLVLYTVRVCARRRLTSVFLGSTAALVLIVGIVISDSPLAVAIYERIFVDTRSYQDRWKDYALAFEIIEQNTLFGDGYYNLSFGGFFAAHNLFIAAWVQAGIFAFLCAIWFWLAFMLMWGRSIVRSILDREYWHLALPVEWVMALPMLGMFRLWSSGDGGNLNFAAWLSIGIFAGLVLLNEFGRVVAKRSREGVGGADLEQSPFRARQP